ncbi:MAG: hypothetical protein QOJ90_1386 [Actinomycetota bacterium]|jgi:hypothetical protein|nr:hypothetical protein [Actinomycetota bacterium]MDQ1642035.1 hypothetical protein [Actinomycetota bacterium]
MSIVAGRGMVVTRATEGPFGNTFAPAYLTLSLAP